jgi:hypothetical protein
MFARPFVAVGHIRLNGCPARALSPFFRTPHGAANPSPEC